MNNELEDVTQELLSESVGNIDAKRVFIWMQNDDIEVLGATFKLLHKNEHYSRIVPPLCFADYHRFHLRYYERCLRVNPNGTWSDSRYSAAHSFVVWFEGIWEDTSHPREALGELKSLLENLYREGDEELRCCIVTGVLEHLFENPSIREFFDDWKRHSVLRSAYSQAVE
jgi:hypothetical protein